MKKLNSKNEIRKFLDILSRSHSILLLNSNPAHDALQSSLALRRILLKMGKKPTCISSFDVEIQSHLPDIEKVELKDTYSLDYSKYDLVIAVDCSEAHRVIDRQKHPEEFHFPEKAKVVNIDHHSTNSNFGTINIVDPEASCTGEIIYNIFKDKVQIDKDTATLIMGSITDDTGFFILSNTNTQVLKTAAELMEKGADLQLLSQAGFFHRTIKSFHLVQRALSTLKIHKVGRTKYLSMSISLKDQEELHCKKLDLDLAKEILAHNFVSNAREVDFGILLKEAGENFVDCDFRSHISKTDVYQIAKRLGGGGHKNAAGASLYLPLKKAEENVHKAIKELLS